MEQCEENVKIIVFYLPQFHAIPENDQWWGTGYTEWVNVRKAKPLFEGHYQPRVPLNNNYYNLLDNHVISWQVDLANKYGIYGFCFYHYWFSGHLLLEKPAEQFLAEKALKTHFCMCWANETWTNTWVSDDFTPLIEQKYGDEQEWEKHFNYLLPFFLDERYIKNDNKPLFVIYRPDLIDDLEKMLTFWQDLAKHNGFKGIDFAYQHIGFDRPKYRKQEKLFTYNIEYQPMYARFNDNYTIRWLKEIKEKVFGRIDRILNKKLIKICDYDKTWGTILTKKPRTEKSIPGAFVGWDNTPRRGVRGYLDFGASPEKFQKYLTKQISRTRDIYHQDMLFMFAWNEWAEGGYLEPDTEYEYKFLEAIRASLIANSYSKK